MCSPKVFLEYVKSGPSDGPKTEKKASCCVSAYGAGSGKREGALLSFGYATYPRIIEQKKRSLVFTGALPT